MKFLFCLLLSTLINTDILAQESPGPLDSSYFEKALADNQDIISKNNGMPNPALALLQQKKYKEAGEEYDLLIRKYTKQPEYYLPRILINLYINKDYKKAFEDIDYMRSVNYSLYYPRFSYLLGLAYYGLEDWPMTYSKTGDELNNKDSSIVLQVFAAYQKSILKRYGTKVTFQDVIKSAKEAAHIDYNALFKLADTAKKERINLYQSYFDEAVKLNPYNFRAYINMGAALEKVENYEKAIALYTLASEMDAADKNYYNTYLIGTAKRKMNGEDVTAPVVQPSNNYKVVVKYNSNSPYCQVPSINGDYINRMNDQIKNDINNWNSVTKYGQMYRESPSARNAMSRVSSSYNAVSIYCLKIKSDAERLKRMCDDPSKKQAFDAVIQRAGEMQSAAESQIGKWNGAADN